MEQKKRLVALDVLRGVTIMLMILCNNQLGDAVYAPLEHASWNGLTMADCVFPFFVFIMGISEYFSLAKYDFAPSKKTIIKLLKRFVLLMLIGWCVGYLSKSLMTMNELLSNGTGFMESLTTGLSSFANIRLTGVFMRLAVVYLISAMLALIVNHRYFIHAIAGIFIFYFVMLLLFNGFELSERNIISIIDRAVFGVSHIYKDAGIPLDPEGLFGCLPTVAHAMMGFLCGKLLYNKELDVHERLARLYTLGVALLLLGLILSCACPINKKIWSPSFSVITSGTCMLMLGLLIWVIDIRRYQKFAWIFQVFGSNAIFSYCVGTVMTIIRLRVWITTGGAMYSLTDYLYKFVFQPIFGGALGSLVFSLLFLSIVWFIAYILYRKRIYIRL